MHGAIRYLRSAARRSGRLLDSPAPEVTDRPAVPWWDPGADTSVSPETDHVLIDGVAGRQGLTGGDAARHAAGPTRRTCSWPAGRPSSRQSSSMSTGRCTWPSRRPMTRLPTCSATTAGSSTSRRMKSFPCRRPPSTAAQRSPRGGKTMITRLGQGGTAGGGDSAAIVAVGTGHQAVPRTTGHVTGGGSTPRLAGQLHHDGRHAALLTPTQARRDHGNNHRLRGRLHRRAARTAPTA